MATISPALNGQVELVTSIDSSGSSFVAVLVKRSYDIQPGKAVSRSALDTPLHKVDKYYDGGDPLTSTVQFESDMAALRRGTDVVIVGSAYSPRGQPVERMTVACSVGDRTKSLLIWGDRTAHYNLSGLPRYADPKPFVTMPLRYELAYGGKDETSDPNVPFWYPRNDMGRGVVLGSDRSAIEGLLLPNIEDPRDQLTPERLSIGDPRRWHLQPIPQGLGWRQRNWFPRCAFVGACPPFLDVDTVTVEERQGILPADYVAQAIGSRLAPDTKALGNGASPDMIFDSLALDALVQLDGLWSSGSLRFSLPGDRPSIALDVGRGLNTLDAALLSVSIEPENLRVDMLWAGIQPIGDVHNWKSVTKLQPEVL